jgi:hypothetical protein
MLDKINLTLEPEERQFLKEALTKIKLDRKDALGKGEVPPPQEEKVLGTLKMIQGILEKLE